MSVHKFSVSVSFSCLPIPKCFDNLAELMCSLCENSPFWFCQFAGWSISFLTTTRCRSQLKGVPLFLFYQRDVWPWAGHQMRTPFHLYKGIEPVAVLGESCSVVRPWPCVTLAESLNLGRVEFLHLWNEGGGCPWRSFLASEISRLCSLSCLEHIISVLGGTMQRNSFTYIYNVDKLVKRNSLLFLHIRF